MRADQEVRRGEQARRLLEDPLLSEAFVALEASLRDSWVATQPDQVAERERLWLMLKLLERLKGHLSEVIETGRLGERALANLAGRSSPMR
jgi:hypothetical protein